MIVNRRTKRQWRSLLAAFAALALLGATAAQAQSENPNIVVLWGR
jgi:hypothetical protein